MFLFSLACPLATCSMCVICVWGFVRRSCLQQKQQQVCVVSLTALFVQTGEADQDNAVKPPASRTFCLNQHVSPLKWSIFSSAFSNFCLLTSHILHVHVKSWTVCVIKCCFFAVSLSVCWYWFRSSRLKLFADYTQQLSRDTALLSNLR